MNSSIIYIMGVSGSGKTTIGELLSKKIDVPFFDADDFHPESNKDKMKNGIALNDEDRQGWLEALNKLAKQQMGEKGAIVACSALKKKYRQILSQGISVPIRWIFLQGSFELIAERLNSRKGHFMPPNLLQSQFDILEVPAGAIVADISETPEKIVENLLSSFHFQS